MAAATFATEAPSPTAGSSQTCARVAGASFLLYIASGIAGMALGPGRLGDALHALTLVVSVLLALALFMVTRHVAPAVAAVGLVLRASEGFVSSYVDALWGTMVFAAGSTLFSALLVKGRFVPAPLAWASLASSVLLLVALPFVGIDWATPLHWVVWIPMLVVEVTLGLWLLVRGVRA